VLSVIDMDLADRKRCEGTEGMVCMGLSPPSGDFETGTADISIAFGTFTLASHFDFPAPIKNLFAFSGLQLRGVEEVQGRVIV
jgi:hypothetical protein